MSQYELRDFRKGIYRKAAIATSIVPENSVAHAININFDTIIGSAQVRLGTTLWGLQVSANNSPLGMAEYVNGGGGTNNLVAVFSGAASTSTIFYYDTQWRTSNKATLSTTAPNRFAMLGNQLFVTNATDGMFSSSDGGATWGTTNSITSVSPAIKPSLVFATKNLLVAGGDTSTTQGRSRIFFSGVVTAPNNPGSITWNTNATTGNWIDISPDDGSDLTAFGETSGLLIAFKDKKMYRVDAIAATVDTDNVYDFGTPSQEAVVRCQGVLYFFTGKDIRRTDGRFPEQISRLGVQDFIDAIPTTITGSNAIPDAWKNVTAATDGLNVFFSIGNVTVPTTGEYATTYNNVVLKFSPRDESWSIHSYGTDITKSRFALFTNSTNGRKMMGADNKGNVQTYDLGATDNGTAISYTLETQELEFGVRHHLKKIADKLVVFTNFGLDSELQLRPDDKDFKTIEFPLYKRINYIKNVNIEFFYLTLRWTGISTQKSPIFEGFVFEEIVDQGVVQ